MHFNVVLTALRDGPKLQILVEEVLVQVRNVLYYSLKTKSKANHNQIIVKYCIISSGGIQQKNSDLTSTLLLLYYFTSYFYSITFQN